MPNISRTKTWSSEETLTASDLNAEFDGILAGTNDNSLDQDNLSKTDDYTMATIIVGSGISSADGQLHVHLASAGTVAANASYNDVVIENDAAAGLTFLTPNTAAAGIVWGDPEDNDIGSILYDHAQNDFAFTIAATGDVLVISSTLATLKAQLTVGVDDTGHDVQFFGATAGAHLLWDESADTLKLVGAAKTDMQGTLTVGVDDTGYDVLFYGATSGQLLQWDESANRLGVGLAPTDGKLHVHTASAGSITANANADEIVAENSGHAGISILSGNTSVGSLYFGDDGDNLAGVVNYDHNTNIMNVGTVQASAVTRFYSADANITMTLDADGKVLSGDALSAGAKTGLGGRNADFQILSQTGGSAGIQLMSDNSGPFIDFVSSKANDVFATFSKANDGDQVGSLNFGIDDGTDYNSRCAEIRCLVDGTTGTNDTPGRLSFHTTPDGTQAVVERMRIDNAGFVGIGDTSPSYRLEVATSTTGTQAFKVDHSHATGPHGIYLLFSGGSPDDNSQQAFQFADSTTARCYIWSDGDLANHDGTYGTISDVKFKQDIVPARSYWDDFKTLKYSKWRDIDDVAKDPDAPYRLGLIAQDVESVFPACVPESPDSEWFDREVTETDEDGNESTRIKKERRETSTTHKWVKSSIIEGPIMARVVQELQARVEALESA